MRDIKELEHAGDRITHDLIDLINRTFVTPFDRDDMYRLAAPLAELSHHNEHSADKLVAYQPAARLHDICDHIDGSAEKIVGYGVQDIRDDARSQAALIQRCAMKLPEA